MFILQNTKSTVNVIPQNFVDYEKTTERNIFGLFNLLNDQCVPLAEVEIDCDLGHVKIKVVLLQTIWADTYQIIKLLLKYKPFFNEKKENGGFAWSQTNRAREKVEVQKMKQSNQKKL
ncbi:hypothetical protein NPIL_219241 [Nephila pilipes]|uniref:Uncharacterized protein n=1 Tax=Nephila pilipes TaxID=299642 RepID=A0A8X6QUL3_NEPPI|nr:hypothetical protein NPIL_219241 [Nephila pilipes]